MKHTEETKRKISETLKRKGIKPIVLSSKEQCKKNLRTYLMKKGDTPWNKGKKGLQKAWNKGKEYTQVKGEKNGNWKGGLPKCECGKEMKSRYAEKCIKCSVVGRSGKNHYNWKGGAKTEILKIRTSFEYKSFKMDVFSRDWFTCQYPSCGYKGKDIECHHIKRVKEYPELIIDKNNGITLCKECHKNIRNNEKKYEKLFEEIVKLKGLTVYIGIRE